MSSSPHSRASFDSAAQHYDATRGFPPGVGEVVADAALQMLEGRRNVLEVGIGTGRIARPLLMRGVRITGLDLSRKMMDQLLEALAPGLARPPLVQAAAEALPLRPASVEAVVSVHVFHLVGDWQAALAEVRRVLLPSGIFLTGYEWRPADSPGTRLMQHWRDIVRAHGGAGTEPGARDFADVKAELIAMGAKCDERLVGEWSATRTLLRHLETIEHRTWSSTWNVPDGFFAVCLAELRAWAANEYGPLEREFTVPHRFIWQRFRWD